VVEVEDDLPEFSTIFITLPNIADSTEFETKNKGEFVKRATAAVGQSSLYKDSTVQYKGPKTVTYKKKEITN
jgi:hypothetical protein